MSVTMLVGRVVLPAAAILLAIALAWHSVRSITARTGPGPVRPDALPAGGPSSATTVSPGRVTAEGRIVAYPGAEVTVGTEVLGTIISMPARENVAVRKGDLLLELRADEVRASLRRGDAP